MLEFGDGVVRGDLLGVVLVVGGRGVVGEESGDVEAGEGFGGLAVAFAAVELGGDCAVGCVC